MRIVIERASVLNVSNTEVTLRNGVDKFALQLVEAKVKNDGKFECIGFEVSHSDNISRLNIQEGKTYTIFCNLSAREYGGRYTYNLQAYAAKEIVEQQNTEAVNNPF